MYTKKFIPFVLIVVLFGLCSCATIFSGKKAKVTLNGNTYEAVTIKTDVKSYNNVRFPAQVMVKRKGGTSRITITGDDYNYQDIILSKKFNGSTLWNILFNYGIGIGVDALTGSINKPSQKVFFVEGSKKELVIEDSKVNFSGKSDVDLDIPKTALNNDKCFAIIIANEDYQREAKVDFAKNDGVTFKKYCHQVLGLPEKNVHLIENGTLNNMIYELDWLEQVCKAYNGEASVIFYYAGHGVPDEASGNAYLLPSDGIGNNMRTCMSTEELYKTLGDMPAKNVTVLMDACFSGAKRSGEMLASARGVAIQAKQSEPKGNMVVLSAAKGDETAYSYKENQHGLFTYFLLKKLKETKGAATLGELAKYVKDEVARFSIVENGKSQTPTVSASTALGDSWKKVTLK